MIMRNQSLPNHRQSGFSLIEMMISLTLGLIILGALAGMMINQSKQRNELDQSTRMIANGTYALDLLSDNIRLAGYYDAYDPTSLPLPLVMPDPCSVNSANMAAALRLHVQGYDAATSTSAATSPPSCVTSVATGLKAGSDILVVRRVDTATYIDPAAAVSGTHYLQASLCSLDASGFTLETHPANFTLRQKGCTASSTTPYAWVRPFHVEIYFVDSNNNAGDGVPTLKMVQLQSGAFSNAIPLVEGVDFLQVDYGLDTNNDGVADSYTSCAACTIADWANVVAVKLHLVARAEENTRKYVEDRVLSLGSAGTVGPFADAIKRSGYYQTVRLINPASRKEVP